MLLLVKTPIFSNFCYTIIPKADMTFSFEVKEEEKILCIQRIKSALLPKFIECILPIHGFLGCDTISQIHSNGNIKNRGCCHIFSKFLVKNSDETTITDAGEKYWVYCTHVLLKIHCISCVINLFAIKEQPRKLLLLLICFLC